MAYCILRVEKIKSLSILSHHHMHNFRLEPTNNADPALFYKNEELINKTLYDYNYLWRERIARLEAQTGEKAVKRKDAIRALEVLMTFSHDSDKFDLEEWKKANIAWLKETFGEENVLSACYHADEGTPHIHAIVVPIDERNRLCAKSFTGGKKAMQRMQTNYAKKMAPFGLQRGLENTRESHKEIKAFYRELKATRIQDIPVMEKDETWENYYKRLQEAVKARELFHLGEKQKSSRKYIELLTSHGNMKKRYKKAMKLYDIWCEKYGEDGANAKFDALLSEAETLGKIHDFERQ